MQTGFNGCPFVEFISLKVSFFSICSSRAEIVRQADALLHMQIRWRKAGICKSASKHQGIINKNAQRFLYVSMDASV